MTNNRVWHLVARQLSGEASLDELRELEQILLDDSELAYQVELYTGYFNAPTESAHSDEEKRNSWEHTKTKLAAAFPGSFETIEETIPSNKLSKWILNRRFTVAASALAIITIASFLLITPVRDKRTTNAALPVNELKTMPGTRTKMILPDGTLVWLNSDSYLTYNKDFGKKTREITLTGEAYFDVAHNPDVPMVVHARSVNIWVKGTAFNVRNYPETGSIETSLIRGSVELTTNDDPERKILLKPSEKITIDSRPVSTSQIEKKGEPIPVPEKPSYYHIERLKESALSKTIPEIAWIDNKLVFDNESFSEVIMKMEKWYNTKFILQNNELAMKKFSGAFDKETVYEALSALQMIHHFEFTMDGNEVLIK